MIFHHYWNTLYCSLMDTRESPLAAPGSGNRKRNEKGNWEPFNPKLENRCLDISIGLTYGKASLGAIPQSKQDKSVIKSSISASSKGSLSDSGILLQ